MDLIDLPRGFFDTKPSQAFQVACVLNMQCFTSSKVCTIVTKSQSGEKQEWPIGLKHSRHTRTFLWFA